MGPRVPGDASAGDMRRHVRRQIDHFHRRGTKSTHPGFDQHGLHQTTDCFERTCALTAEPEITAQLCRSNNAGVLHLVCINCSLHPELADPKWNFQRCRAAVFPDRFGKFFC